MLLEKNLLLYSFVITLTLFVLITFVISITLLTFVTFMDSYLGREIAAVLEEVSDQIAKIGNCMAIPGTLPYPALAKIRASIFMQHF